MLACLFVFSCRFVSSYVSRLRPFLRPPTFCGPGFTFPAGEFGTLAIELGAETFGIV